MASSHQRNIPLGKIEFHVFLTHNWGPKPWENHQRVSVVNAGLAKRGLKTWFDEVQMEGDISRIMTKGVEKSCVVVVFITAEYIRKVDSDMDNNCKFEFYHARAHRTPNNMIPVLMERVDKPWNGPVGAVLGYHLYVDMIDVPTEESITELFNMIMQKIGKEVGPCPSLSLASSSASSTLLPTTTPVTTTSTPNPTNAAGDELATILNSAKLGGSECQTIENVLREEGFDSAHVTEDRAKQMGIKAGRYLQIIDAAKQAADPSNPSPTTVTTSPAIQAQKHNKPQPSPVPSNLQPSNQQQQQTINQQQQQPNQQQLQRISTDPTTQQQQRVATLEQTNQQQDLSLQSNQQQQQTINQQLLQSNQRQQTTIQQQQQSNQQQQQQQAQNISVPQRSKIIEWHNSKFIFASAGLILLFALMFVSFRQQQEVPVQQTQTVSTRDRAVGFKHGSLYLENNTVRWRKNSWIGSWWQWDPRHNPQEAAAVKRVEMKNSGISGEDFLVFSGVVTYCPNIEYIDLGNNNLGDEGVSALAEALPVLPKLNTLWLWDNKITIKGTQGLCRALPSLPLLQLLSLGGNNFGDEGVSALAEALPPALPKLKELHLHGCGLGDRGVGRVVGALRNMPSLTTVDLRYNRASEQVKQTARNTLSVVETLRL